jgi:uncharacterized protein YdhG (YjbR/CyaY superfamily)
MDHHVFRVFLDEIHEKSKRNRVQEVLSWIQRNYPDLTPVIKWNQPMFMHQGTFIIAFSVAKEHLAVSPEQAGIERFNQAIHEAGYRATTMLFRIPWNQEVRYDLLAKMIKFNCEDKKGLKTFWRQ